MFDFYIKPLIKNFEFKLTKDFYSAHVVIIDIIADFIFIFYLIITSK